MMPFGVVLAAALAANAAVGQPQLAKTDPKTWSKSGWQEFRFGMGPGDVAEVARRVGPKAALPFHRVGTDGETYIHDRVAVIAGQEVGAMFDFLDGRLAKVTVQYYATTVAAGDVWERDVRRALEAKYGAPEVFPSFIAWRRKDLVIRLTPLGIWYSDPKAEAEERRRQRAQDRRNADAL
jgi:hypothetical protein